MQTQAHKVYKTDTYTHTDVSFTHSLGSNGEKGQAALWMNNKRGETERVRH